MNRVIVRPLEGMDELEACVDLQKETWGAQFDDVVSAALMLVSRKIGGVAAGAFDAFGSMAGTIFGLTGIRGDERVHWSHMLAVEPTRRGEGIGRLLKLYQRRAVMGLGVKTMYWTFDPLEARNAHFNVNRLKARVSQYVPDMYGTGDASTLHRGIGTDRLLVRWDLAEGDVIAALREDAARIDWHGNNAAAELPFDSHAEGAPSDLSAPVAMSSPSDERRTVIEIPPNIQELKTTEPAAVREWRTYVRTSFSHYLGRGYAVVSFVRDPRAGRCFYVLEKESG